MSIKTFISAIGFATIVIIGSDSRPAAQCSECLVRDSLLAKGLTDTIKAHAVKHAIAMQMLTVDSLHMKAANLFAELVTLRNRPVRIIVKHKDVVGNEVWLWRYYEYPNGKTKFKDVIIKHIKP